MKQVILLCLIGFTIASRLRLQIEPKISLVNSYELACSGAKGQVSYQATNLPAGVSLIGNRIEIVDSSKCRNGYFPVKIKATD